MIRLSILFSWRILSTPSPHAIIFYQNVKSTHSHFTSIPQVEMETVASALFVLIFGLAASGMILALEVSYDLWQRRSTASKSADIGQEWRRTAEEQHKQRCNHPAASPKDNVGEKDFEFVN